MVRRICILFVVCLLNLSLSNAQPDPIVWGKLSPTDLLMHNYNRDTTAPALILCDYGNLSIEVINDQYRVVFRHFKRIKIFKKSAYAEANIELLFNRTDKESISEIKAESISPLASGGFKISVLKDEDILDQEADENWNRKIFAIPGVVEGSIIEFSYAYISMDFFNYKTWSFQSQLPCLWSELRAELSGVYNYMVLLHNVKDSLYINEKTDGFKTIPDQMLNNTSIRIPIRVKSTKGRYVMKDIPPLVEEPYITCLQDYRMEIRFQLYSVSKPYNDELNIIRSWSELAQRLNEEEYFGKWLGKDIALKELVYQIVKDMSTSEYKMRAIYDYVRTHYRWNSEFRVMARKPAGQVLNQKSGNSAELNLLLIQMLNLAGVHAVPVIISTRGHGRIQKEFPVLNQFNHLICLAKVDTSTFLLDAIDPYRPYNLLATDDLNSSGLAIEGTSYKWISVTSSFPTKRNSLFSMKIDSSGNIKGDLIIDETGYFAHNRRAALASMDKAKFIDYLMNFFTIDLTVDTFSISNQYEIEAPLRITVSFSAKKAIDYMFQKDVIYFEAMIFNNMRNNPFKQQTRSYPVDFSYPYEESSAQVVQVPKGYTFEELPQDEHFIVPDENAEFLFLVFNTTKVFQVKSILKIKKANFALVEYPDLKLLFDLMVQKNSEHITAIRDR